MNENYTKDVQKLLKFAKEEALRLFHNLFLGRPRQNLAASKTRSYKVLLQELFVVEVFLLQH